MSKRQRQKNTHNNQVTEIYITRNLLWEMEEDEDKRVMLGSDYESP